MKTSFFGARVEAESKPRNDGFGSYDLKLTILQSMDASFCISVDFPCVTREDIEGMIAELEKAKNDIPKI